MHKDCKQVRDMVDLWHETQMGHYKKCAEKQFEFAEMMWKLYNNKNKIKEKQTMGRAIDMENNLQKLETRVKLVEDALEEMIQTRVHHVDLHDELDKHEENIRKENNVKTEGVTVEPDKEFLPPTDKRKKTTRTKTATVG